MKIPWFLPRCGYPGCRFKVWKRNEIHCRQHHEQVLKKIDDLLKAAGSDKSKLLSATIFLADIRGFDEMNAAWDAWVVAGSTPGRATVEARLANSKFLVEIVAIAAV